MKGYRTILIGLGLAVLPPALSYLAGVDWNSLVGTQGAMMISGAIMIFMRMITTTPVGGSGPPAIK